MLILDLKNEQNVNQNVLICRGPTVESLIRDSEVDGRPSPERVKGELFKSVCGDSAINVITAEVRVSVFTVTFTFTFEEFL